MASIVLFNNDLRIKDNPALFNACKNGEIIPIFILDEKVQSYGKANKVWLHYALLNLDKSLAGKLVLLKGNSHDVLLSIIKKTNAKSVYWNRSYEPKLVTLFKQIKADLKQKNITAESYNSSFLSEPYNILKKDGSYYKVFKPFYTKVLENLVARVILPSPTEINFYKHNVVGLKLDELNLLPQHKWSDKLISYWDISEEGASKQLDEFVKKQQQTAYESTRDIPMLDSTSKLSPYLRFGQISVQQIVEKVKNISSSESFIRQLIWRDYCYYLTYHFEKDLAQDNFNQKFDNWHWSNNQQHLKAWQFGKTGIPLVDAGMRELYETGYMHNRVRMVAGSFLVKNLNIDWREGKKWFDDCLFDADIACNSFGWQWVAGTGCDASPYYRVFNPNLQLDKFDGARLYVKSYIKEYQTKDYPLPIVDIKETSLMAKERYKAIKSN